MGSAALLERYCEASALGSLSRVGRRGAQSTSILMTCAPREKLGSCGPAFEQDVTVSLPHIVYWYSTSVQLKMSNLWQLAFHLK